MNTENGTMTTSNGKLLQLVSFHVGSEEFGLDILRVQEIIRIQPLTRVPNLPSYINGVINLRGSVIPVIGLRDRLGLDTQAADKKTRIIVANVHEQVLGFVVDEVSEVLRIHSDTVETTPRIGEIERDYISGIGKLDSRLLLLLNLEELVTEAELNKSN
jgi:purine-binding chemotaxis protein CheW